MKFYVGDIVFVKTRACQKNIRLVIEVDDSQAYPYRLHVPQEAQDITQYWQEHELTLIRASEVES